MENEMEGVCRDIWFSANPSLRVPPQSFLGVVVTAASFFRRRPNSISAVAACMH